RELSPWRYASIPDALVLARIALLTVGVFLLWVFVLDRARGLPRSTLFMAPMFQMVGSMGIRILRRALHEHALDSFSPLKTITDRVTQSPSLLLIGPPSLADTYLRDVARSHDRTYTPVGIVGTDARDVGQRCGGSASSRPWKTSTRRWPTCAAGTAIPAPSCSSRSRRA
ncbi:MAG: hypothetical protein ABI655_00720, partial [Phenylobacterium sp.]